MLLSFHAASLSWLFQFGNLRQKLSTVWSCTDLASDFSIVNIGSSPYFKRSRSSSFSTYAQSGCTAIIPRMNPTNDAIFLSCRGDLFVRDSCIGLKAPIARKLQLQPCSSQEEPSLPKRYRKSGSLVAISPERRQLVGIFSHVTVCNHLLLGI